MVSAPGKTQAAGETSAWTPLRDKIFRGLWIGVLASNVGTWMQTVGAQWHLVHEPAAATYVSLVQTATMLPVLLLALPSGTLADTFDRRRLLLAVQVGLFAVAATLTTLTALDRMPPPLLLLVFPKIRLLRITQTALRAKKIAAPPSSAPVVATVVFRVNTLLSTMPLWL